MMYVLVAWGGQYDDAWENNRLASFDKNKLETMAMVKNAEVEALHIKEEEYYRLMGEWETKNRLTRWTRWRATGLKPRVLFQSMPGVRQVITDEMRPQKAYYEASRAYSALRETEEGRVRALIGFTLEQKIGYGSLTGYRVEEVPFEE